MKRVGWGSAGGKEFGIQQVVWDGRTMPFAMRDLKLTEKGFRIVFTKPVEGKLAADPDNYTLERWGYLYHPKYGSPKTEVMREKPGKVRVSDDGLTVELETTLQTDRVYKFSLDPIRAEDGSTMSDARAWYTLNRLKV